jgi:hypothetical protein
MNNQQVSAFKVLSLYSINCILKSYVKQRFSAAVILLFRGHLTMFGAIFGCYTGVGDNGTLWVETGMLLTLLQCTGQPSPSEIIQLKMSVVLSLKTPDVK